MSQQRVLPQSKETLLQSYNKRLKDDIKSIMDNFTEIIKTARIEEETQVSRATQGEQDNYEMHVRAANIVGDSRDSTFYSSCNKEVRAGESLMKLVSDLKQFLILNDFPLVNEAINQRNQQLRSLQEDCDKKLVSLRDEISIDLYELEEEYYSSSLCDRNDLPLCEAYWSQDGAMLSPEDASSPSVATATESNSITLQGISPRHQHVNGHETGQTEHT
uniref:Mediator of RNA polymerase II transcription subunit 22 n=1 Tax=Geotrypetes seraphini TaxID=260995 RepID=A0A6P8SKW5_GEOSA|nr:mediator of RNA polymerase II transcription subunit 22 isoform X2 [Geotrypetes seraphini]